MSLPCNCCARRDHGPHEAGCDSLRSDLPKVYTQSEVNALVGAAYADAANTEVDGTDTLGTYDPGGNNQHRKTVKVRVGIQSILRDAIKQHTPADAQRELERQKQAAWERGRDAVSGHMPCVNMNAEITSCLCGASCVGRIGW